MYSLLDLNQRAPLELHMVPPEATSLKSNLQRNFE
ncbi:unnamed protein product [Acanthoscelides obtectus]|uniref:Uncharacterized protein n=1 Tax=Acanthoscelides obtectus TaxID=200917 RepID=A0A9P0K1N7_ACAOB|nr:unnamed protein product [Acanthoscelides obtectus]CAK1665937.1 hypothetical protein AOBTE_LOCUS25060 [Acanthoscelides obtectus]